MDGKLYGVAGGGGANNDGTVFSITPDGTFTTIYAFGGTPNDGLSPSGALLAENGVLYGVTKGGGTNNLGTLFSITPQGIETVIYSFNGANGGSYPTSNLVKLGNQFFGTTQSCVLYSLTLSGDYHLEHGFGCAPYPTNDLSVAQGVGYGTTAGGSGENTVFSFKPSSGYTLIITLPDNFSYPQGGLVYDSGTLFGVTQAGGALGYGAIFSFAP